MALFRVALLPLLLVSVASMMTHQPPMGRSKKAQGRRPANTTDEDTHMSQHRGRGHQPDIAKAVADARETMEAVNHLALDAEVAIQSTNATGVQLLQSLGGNFASLKDSVEAMNSTADQVRNIPFVSSADVVELVAKFVDQVITIVRAAQEDLARARENFILSMEHISLTFETAANKTLAGFEHALLKIEALQSAYIIFLQHSANQSATGEFWPLGGIFGGPFGDEKKSTFDQARSAISSANETLDALFAEVDKINGTIVEGLILGVVDVAQEVASGLQEQCLAITPGLPTALKHQASSFCMQSTDTLVALGTAIRTYTETVPGVVDQLRGKLTPMKSLPSTLLDAVEQVENFAEFIAAARLIK